MNGCSPEFYHIPLFFSGDVKRICPSLIVAAVVAVEFAALVTVEALVASPCQNFSISGDRAPSSIFDLVTAESASRSHDAGERVENAESSSRSSDGGELVDDGGSNPRDLAVRPFSRWQRRSSSHIVGTSFATEPKESPSVFSDLRRYGGRRYVGDLTGHRRDLESALFSGNVGRRPRPRP
ncbi:hypothetical protein TIFTF001_009152 [Ficus carica]|uniref:Uncharacterized protein n=1 Tax=Ficus carica TaxID=3494 RepID=A0AA87ZU70_FICCA|nr:hypothetical protein TIFTF001_009152 [Ficus carica]